MTVDRARKRMANVKRVTVELEEGVGFVVEGVYVKDVEMELTREPIELHAGDEGFDDRQFHYKQFRSGPLWVRMRMLLEGPGNVTTTAAPVPVLEDKPELEA